MFNFLWAAAWNALKIDIVVQLTVRKDYRPSRCLIMTPKQQKVNAGTRKNEKWYGFDPANHQSRKNNHREYRKKDI